MKILAIAALILGLGGLLVGGNIIMGVLALIFGFLAQQKADKETKIFALSGIILGLIIILWFGVNVYQTKHLANEINEAAMYLGVETTGRDVVDVAAENVEETGRAVEKMKAVMGE